MFNLALGSKLRACDLITLHVRDIAHGSEALTRATILQRKTQRPVVFKIMPTTRRALAQWIADAKLFPADHLFPGRSEPSMHLSTRQYARIVDDWCCQIGLDATAYGTHSMRRTKVSMIYERTRNIRAVQLLLGHRKLENTVRYLGVELQDALALSEETEI
jgi:integrase